MKVLYNECYWCGGDANLKMSDQEKTFWFCNHKCFTDLSLSIDKKEIQKTRLKLNTALIELRNRMNESQRTEFDKKIGNNLL